MGPEDEMMEPGMEPGMGMGGGRDGGGAAGLQWTEEEPPEELTMTYDEYISRTGNVPTVPDDLTQDEDGNPKQETFNTWSQLQRVYGEARAVEEVPAGRVGGPIEKQMRGEIAYGMKLFRELARLYEMSKNGFSCKVGHPISVYGTNLPEEIPTQVPVILQVKPWFQKSFGTKCYNALKKYDRPETRMGGEGPQINAMPIVTYQHGYWRPIHLQLGVYTAPIAVSFWNDLWSRNRIRLTIFNKLGEEIYSEEQPANQGASILYSIANPPELRYQPRYRMLLPTDDLAFNGGRLNLNGTKGWMVMFDISSMPRHVSRQMDTAKAEFIIQDDVEAQVQERSQFIEDVINEAFRGGGAGPEAGPEDMPGEEDMMEPPEDEMMPPEEEMPPPA
ncbi:MAG: hypothetical protein ACLFWB_13980 [Armatimonadota bacterium]